MLPTVSTVEAFAPGTTEHDRKEACGSKGGVAYDDVTSFDGKWHINMPNLPGPPAARRAVAASNDTIFVVSGMTSWDVIGGGKGSGEGVGTMFTDSTYVYMYIFIFFKLKKNKQTPTQKNDQ